MTIRAIAAESKVEMYDKQVAALNGTITAQQKTIEIAETQLKKQTESRNDAGQVFTIDQARIEACQAQLAKADARIWALEHPGLLKRIFKPESLVGFGAGYFVGQAKK